MVLARLKLRSDMLQRYEDIRFSNILLDHAEGTVMAAEPWSQYTDLKGMVPPKSWVRELEFSGIRDVPLKNIDLQLVDGDRKSDRLQDLVFDHVMINGRQRTAPFTQR